MSDQLLSLTLQRRIAAPPAMVYEMLVDPAELRHWLGPSEFVVTRFSGEVRVGGRFQFRMRRPGGEDYGAEGEYRELAQNERVVFSWRWHEAPATEVLDRRLTLVTISLRADGEHTLLTLTHAQLPDEISVQRHGQGWSAALNKLIARVETREKGQIMKTEVVLAAVAVADIERAIAWYGQLLGRAYDDRPMKEAAEWRVLSHAGIQLVADPERAGRSMVTIGVADIDQVVRELGARGVQTRATAAGHGPFRLAQVRDPDGNLLTFSQDQRA